MVDDDLRRDEECAPGDGEAAEGVGLRGGARRDPDGRIETQRFGEVLPGERKLRVVCRAGGFSCEDLLRFVVQALLPFGMERGEPEGEAEAVGRGFMPGEQQGKAFVAHLAISHAAGLAFGVDCGHKHGEQIALVWIAACMLPGVTGAALPDEAIDERVEFGFALTDAAHDREREARDLRREGQKCERQEAHEGVDGGGDIAGFGFDVSIE